MRVGFAVGAPVVGRAVGAGVGWVLGGLVHHTQPFPTPHEPLFSHFHLFVQIEAPMPLLKHVLPEASIWRQAPEHKAAVHVSFTVSFLLLLQCGGLKYTGSLSDFPCVFFTVR